MRTLLLSFAALVLVGCAAQPSRNVVYSQRSRPAPVAAAALVFDPPIVERIPRLDFDRDERQPAAYVAYEESVATFYYTRTDDHQVNYPPSHSGWRYGDNNENQGYYEREAISETSGVRYR